MSEADITPGAASDANAKMPTKSYAVIPDIKITKATNEDSIPAISKGLVTSKYKNAHASLKLQAMDTSDEFLRRSIHKNPILK